MFQFAASSFQPRHGRLFELIRQQNLQDCRRHMRGDEAVGQSTADRIIRVAQASVLPAPGWQKTAL